MAHTYILVATDTEHTLALEYQRRNAAKLSDVQIIKTGIGRTYIMLNLVKIAMRHTSDLHKLRIINIGLCGSSIKGSHICDIIYPTNFKDGDRDWNNSFVEPDMYPMAVDSSGQTLISGSKFVSNTPIEACFDMEAFDIYAFCKEFGVDLHCVKIVSDFCNETEYLHADKDKLYACFEKALNKIFGIN